jgi:putative ABC transport system permease protein
MRLMNFAAFLETTFQDLRYSLRAMRKNPAFAVTAVLTLALGIGGNTAIFTVIRAVLLKPLEYRDPDRLVYFSMDNAQRNAQDVPFSLTRFEQMKAAAKSFTGLGAFLGSPENMTLSGRGEPEALKGARVSANFLEILGVAPLAGRAFLPDEDRSGAARVVMISELLWRRRFGGDPQIAGQTATLDSTPYTIVGVLPPHFEFPLTGVDVWVPRPSEWSILPPRYWRIAILSGFARLKPAVSLETARAELEVLNKQYILTNPNQIEKSATMRVVRLKDRLVTNVRSMLWMLFGAVGFVLLIACANVASLLLARATSRSREISIRAALGAARGRLIRQLLAESLALAIAGGAIGALMATWVLRAMTLMDALSLSTRPVPIYLPGSGELRVDGMVLGFTLALSILTGVLFGLVPSLQVSRPDLAAVLRESVAGASSRRRTLDFLVVGQVALSIILLIGAALLMQSFARVWNVNPGFQAANLLTMKIALPPARYDADQKKAVFYEELVRRVEALPGVREATMAMSLPTTVWARTNITKVEGQVDPDPGDPTADPVIQSITPGYFHTLRIPLRRGREFTAHDNTPGAPAVIIINEGLARRFWPEYPRGPDPVGQHIAEGYDKAIGWMEIVGIVPDVHEGGLAFGTIKEFYLPNAKHPPQTAYLAIRTDGDPMRFVNAVRAQVRAIDSDQAVSDVKTMEAVLASTLGQRRLTMLLLGSFAGVALLLAVIGIYGVIAYSVAQRTQEVGIRRALGAQQRDILRLVLRQGLVLALIGVALGMAGAFALTRVIEGMLFQVNASDPATYVGIAVLLIVVALLASLIPARRAARIDPMAALRV